MSRGEHVKFISPVSLLEEAGERGIVLWKCDGCDALGGVLLPRATESVLRQADTFREVHALCVPKGGA